ncbi:hypothetical protein MCC10112_0789 [Bifidobacterium longum subsp. longum]|nr:hypothetical protein MCC10097_0822 [Bifidobacterium longum subsp. longum]TCF57552.1 hypothetical protein MCC10112_0789 [Bifidobacterium longum subsp. longum]
MRVSSLAHRYLMIAILDVLYSFLKTVVILALRATVETLMMKRKKSSNANAFASN